MPLYYIQPDLESDLFPMSWLTRGISGPVFLPCYAKVFIKKRFMGE